MRRSGLILMLMGAVCVGFFILTDPRMLGARATRAGWATLAVDAIYEATPGTVLGLVGSGIIVLIGLWLMARRAT
jgi:hypothetical protein